MLAELERLQTTEELAGRLQPTIDALRIVCHDLAAEIVERRRVLNKACRPNAEPPPLPSEPAGEQPTCDIHLRLWWPALEGAPDPPNDQTLLLQTMGAVAGILETGNLGPWYVTINGPQATDPASATVFSRPESTGPSRRSTPPAPAD
jgi:hypothetical protein